jgi:hypothetical protein
MMAADGKACGSDETARLYAGAYLRKLAAAARLKNTLALELFNKNGDPALMTYSLGGGRAYVRRFRGASSAQKETWRSMIRQAAALARATGGAKGAKESKAVVEARAAEMLLGEDGLQMYRLGIHFCLLPFSRDTEQTHTHLRTTRIHFLESRHSQHTQL